MNVSWDELIGQLSSIQPTIRRGVVINVVGSTIEVSCPSLFVGELCRIEILQPEHKSLDAEVVGFRGEIAILMLLTQSEGIAFGSSVLALGKAATISLSNEFAGRMVNACGKPIDNGTELRFCNTQLLKRPAISPFDRKPISAVFSTGIRVIDGLLTIGRGQRIGLFANAGAGKSHLLSSICSYNSSEANGSITVVVLVGERGREVLDFYENALQRDALKSMVIVAATAEEPPLMRIRAIYTGIAIAEFFSSQNRNVLFITDSMTRFAMALREVGLANGEPPTIRGYTASVLAAIPAVIERCGEFSGRGSITGLFSVLVEGELAADPVAEVMKAALDGHIVLSAELAEKDHYPAIDVLKSVSRLFTVLATPMQRLRAKQIRRSWAAYEEKKNLIELGLGDENTRVRLQEDMKLIREFFQQSDQSFPMSESLDWMERLELKGNT